MGKAKKRLFPFLFVKNFPYSPVSSIIDDQISSAETKGSLPPKSPHGWVDKNSWESWKTHVLDKNNTIWEVTRNVANSADGRKLLYDIGPIKKKTTGGAANRFPHIPTDGKANLSQESGNVKGDFSNFSGTFPGKAGSGGEILPGYVQGNANTYPGRNPSCSGGNWGFEAVPTVRRHMGIFPQI